MTAPPALAPSRDRASLIARYDGRAPRYTSYPTAAQFTDQVGAEAYAGWLAQVPADEACSVYVHLPFCARLCWYCGCNTRAVNRPDPITAYVELLAQEMALVAARLPRRLSAASLHLGGGTPNMLSPGDLDRLFEALAASFDLGALEEVAAELDPAVLTPEWVRAAARHGLNRASLGVQNLDAEVQAAVNRRETLDEIAACVGWLREAGVASINFDLMYGLSRQTVANTLATIDALVELEPDRIALFGYAHVPWMKAHQRLIDEAALPDAAERLAQSEAAAERLAEAGYVRIGLDHFARPGDALARAAAEGRLHRNFQGYTADAARTLLGFGASAVGSLAQGFVQNIADERLWRAAVAAGEPPVARGVAVTEDDRFRGEIIERLMCDFAVDLSAVEDEWGARPDVLVEALRRLEPFLADGLAGVRDGRVEIPDEGRFLVRSICAAFDAYLDPAAMKHAKAI